MSKRMILRRQFMIYPNFQMTLIVLNSLVLIIMAMIVGYGAKTAFSHLNQVGIQIHLYKGHPFFLMVTEYTHHFYGLLVLVLSGALIISNGLIVILSHRVTGPLVRLDAYFRNIVRRERAPKTPLRFRESDYFREIPSSLNNALSMLRSGVPEDTQTLPVLKRS